MMQGSRSDLNSASVRSKSCQECMLQAVSQTIVNGPAFYVNMCVARPVFWLKFMVFVARLVFWLPFVLAAQIMSSSSDDEDNVLTSKRARKSIIQPEAVGTLCWFSNTDPVVKHASRHKGKLCRGCGEFVKEPAMAGHGMPRTNTVVSLSHEEERDVLEESAHNLGTAMIAKSASFVANGSRKQTHSSVVRKGWA